MTPTEKQIRLNQLTIDMNPKHLRVCNKILQGMNQGEAWLTVYERVKNLM